MKKRNKNDNMSNKIKLIMVRTILRYNVLRHKPIMTKNVVKFIKIKIVKSFEQFL